MSESVRTATGKITTGADDFVYLCGWLFVGPALALAGANFLMVLENLTTLGVGFATVAMLTNFALLAAALLLWMLLIGLRLLQKIGGHLRRMEAAE